MAAPTFLGYATVHGIDGTVTNGLWAGDTDAIMQESLTAEDTIQEHEAKDKLGEVKGLKLWNPRRNITIEDPRPTLQQFFICMTMPETYSKNAEKRAAGDLSGLLFQNQSIAAPSVLGEPQILWGQADARIRNLTFENLTLGGKPVRDAAFFKTNEFVDGLIFAPGAVSKP